MPFVKTNKINEKFFISNPGHIKKIDQRDCRKEFIIWRNSYKDLRKSYLKLNQALKFLGSTKKSSPKKEQKQAISDLKSALKDYSFEVYSYQQKTTKFVSKYFSSRDIPPFKKIIDVINKRMFFTTPLSFLIELHNCIKHSGSMGFLVFDMGDKGIDFYIKNITTKDEDWWIGSCYSGDDLFNLIKKSIRYIKDIEDDIFLVMVQMS
jgi:hypothetical protein